MKSTKKQLIFFYLVIDLLIMIGSFIVVVSDKKFLAIHNLILIATLMYSFWIIAFLTYCGNIYCLQTGFLYQFRIILKRFLLFLFISSLSILIAFPLPFFNLFIEQSLFFLSGKISSYFLLYLYLKFRRKIDYNIQRAAIITKNNTGVLLERIIDCNPILGYKFIGYLDNEKHGEVLGPVCELDRIIKQFQIHTVFAVQTIASEIFNPFLVSICNRNGVRLRLVTQKTMLNSFKAESSVEIDYKSYLDLPLDKLSSRIIKRLFDIFFSFCVILFLLSWLIPVLAVIIKLTSRGPVFFIQKRTGMNNMTFQCLKFRSMVVNDQSDIKQASIKDNRITSVGKFLRNSSIDELPQFFNVLIGQMSVVGPRPHMLKHTEKYSLLIDNYLIRHYIKPGITGWAQVNGYRGETNQLWKMEKRVEFDRYYLEHWSFIWDLKIIFDTLFGFHSREKYIHNDLINIVREINSNQAQLETSEARLE